MHPGDPIADLVAAALEVVDRDGPEALEPFCRAHDAHAEEIRRRVGVLAATGFAAGDDETAGFPERIGDYRLLRRLGGGGMGVVYLARRARDERLVALKLLRPERLYFDGARERFRREVEAASRLAHPGIVAVHDVGEVDGVPYFAMDWLQGCTLAEVCERLRGRDPAALTGADLQAVVPAGEAADCPLFDGNWVESCLLIARDTALALHHAHEQGVIHRDVKPSNVMIDAQGSVRLLDFGLARLDGGDGTLTDSAAQPGSLPYMAPEQVQGDGDRVDRRTDVFALGSVLYELLTLQRAFAAATAEGTRRAILDGRPTPIATRNRAVPADAVIVCDKALDPDPSRRYGSAAEFAADLDRLLSFRKVIARPPSALRRARRWFDRHPALGTALVLALLIALLGPMALWLVQRRHNDELLATLHEAEGRRLVATARATVATDPGRALLLAIEGASRHRDLAADNALAMAMEACHEMRTLRVDATVVDLAVAPDGSFLAAAAGDGALLVFEPATGDRLATRRDHDSSLRIVRCSRDGALVATGDSKGGVRIWDTTTWTSIAATGHENAITDLHFGPGGTLASASRDGTVRLWEPLTGECRAVLRGHGDVVYAVRFRPDGREVASCSEDRTIRLWAIEGGRELGQLAVPGAAESYWGAVFDVAWSADGHQLAAAYGDCVARLWDLRTRRIEREFRGHSREVYRASWSPDGRALMTVAFDGTTRIWELDGRCRHVFRGRNEYMVAGAFSGDGRLVATAARDGSAAVWDADTGVLRTELLGHTGAVDSVVFAPAGSQVFTASADGTLRVWDCEPRRLRAHAAAVTTLAFAPDGRRCVTATREGDARVWSLPDWRRGAALHGHDGDVLGAAFSSRGDRIVTWSRDGTARIWDADSGEPQGVLGGHEIQAGWAAFGAGDRRIATTSIGVLRVWDARSCRLLAEEAVPRSWMRWPGIVDDRWVVTIPHAASGVCTYDLATGEYRHGPRTGGDGIRATVPAPDGRCLVVGATGAVQIRRAPDLEAAPTLWSHDAAVGEFAIAVADAGTAAIAYRDGLLKVGRRGAAFDLAEHLVGVERLELDRAGELLAVLLRNGTVRVFDTVEARELRIVQEAGLRATAMGFTAAPRQLAVGWNDGSVRIIELVADPLAAAIARRPRQLTADELAQLELESGR